MLGVMLANAVPQPYSRGTIIGLRDLPSLLQGARRIAYRPSARCYTLTPVTYLFSYTAHFLNDDRAKR